MTASTSQADQPAGTDALVAAVAAVPGVTGAVAVARRRLRGPAGRPSGSPPAESPETGESSETAESPETADPAPSLSPSGGPLAELDGGYLELAEGAPATLQEALRAAALTAPDNGTRYLVEGQPDSWQSYPSLLAEAEQVLAGLRAHGLGPGDPALFVFEDNRLYVTAFWACVLGGFVPTPVAVATSYDTPNEVNRKLFGAWELLGRPVILTDPATAGSLAALRRLWDEPAVRIVSVPELMAHPRDSRWFASTADSPVLNLLTSGSTGIPKCVQHTNASVAARSAAVIAHCGLTQDDVSLIWMPLDHVTIAMYNIRDTFARCTHVNARTSHFLGDCLRWLDWVDQYRVTSTWAPNFAFAMVNERSAELADRSWDLSCLREITNGGEPVIVATSQLFLRLLARYGLPADAMVPAWGMSETCSGVTYGRQSRDDLQAGTIRLDPGQLSGAVRLSDALDAVTVSTVGRPIPGVRLRVIGDRGEVLPTDRIGELVIGGSTLMRGYYANPEAMRESYAADGWFRTGDLAFVHDGEVVIIGRTKDQIIVRGVNHLAHELESVVEQVAGLRVTFTAAAGVREPDADTDQLVIFFVPESWEAGSLARLAASVRDTLVREAGLAPDLLVPVTEAEFRKTSSGKIQRSALVEDLRAGRFGNRAVGRPEPQPEQESWIARRRWVAMPTPGTSETPPGGAGDGLVLIAGDEVRQLLGLDNPTVVIAPGPRFEERSPDHFTATVRDRVSLRRLLDTVAARHGRISTVVFAVPPAGSGSGTEPVEALLHTTAELSSLLSAIAEDELGIDRLLVLTTGSVALRPDDRIDLGSCALPGLIRTAVAESNSTLVRQVDLPAQVGEWAGALALERADHRTSGVVAVRDGRRWQPKLEPVDTTPEARSAAPIVAGGGYLITGGLGGIAEHLAGYLLAEYGVRLLLTGRSDLDGQRWRRLTELAELGDVHYVALDVADEAAVQAAVQAAELRWGRTLDGIIHLAGADPTGAWREPDQHTVARVPADAFVEQYRAKVTGSVVLTRLLETRPRTRLILFGSVNGEFGGHSFGAYSAANAFLAGLAHECQRDRDVSCLAWSMWSGVGMSRAVSFAPAQQRGFRSIDPDRGVRLLLSALTTGESYLVLGVDLTHPAIVDDVARENLEVTELVIAYTSTGPVDPAAIEAAAKLARTYPVPVRLAAVPVIGRRTDGSVDEALLLREADRQGDTPTQIAPATDLERRVARIWSAALTRPVAGRDQSFFELGGNSLMAARLLALVDREFGVRIATRDLYERPTVADMAETLGSASR